MTNSTRQKQIDELTALARKMPPLVFTLQELLVRNIPVTKENLQHYSHLTSKTLDKYYFLWHRYEQSV